MPTPSRVGGGPLGAEDGGVAVTDGDDGHPGQLTLPEDGPGMTVQPSWLGLTPPL